MSALLRALRVVALAAAGFLALRAWVFESIVVASASMEPALPVGSRALLDKVTLRLRPPRRGDVLLFERPDAPGQVVGKRVVAVAGDTVELRARRLLLNGAPVREDYVVHRRAGERLVGDDFGPATVPPGELFVLGDNRDESEDSSVWKDPATGKAVPFVPVENVRGLVRFGAAGGAPAPSR